MLYQLNILNMKGEKILVDVSNSEEEFRNTTVEELKRKYLKDYGDYQNVRLLFKDRQLEDLDTLGDYGIRHKSTIFVILRLPGGGPGPPEDEDKRIPRTESMERLASMQQTEPEPNR